MPERVLEPKDLGKVRATKLSEIREWLQSLEQLRSKHTCASPGFFKPYHFVTIALLLKERAVGNLDLPPQFENYAARMGLWEAIGIPNPHAVTKSDGGSTFHPLTRLTDLNAVENVSEKLTDMMAASVAQHCNAETAQSLYIMLTELLGNCHHHARAADDLHGLVCGQTWYKGARAQIAIADSGIGIRSSLGENPDLSRRLRTENACELALKLGISSKLNQGHQGYGLAVAKDLARLTRGATLFVQSYDEAVIVDSGTVTPISQMKNGWPGTLVLFEWDMKQPLDISAVYETWPKAEENDDGFF